jgi:uncharacterized membrane protein YciS (DUF1049 family)
MTINGLLYFQLVYLVSSLLKGQLSYISASKGNFLPFKGTAVLAVYISLSLAVRVFAVLLCYTPILGLFDATHHGKLGILETDLVRGKYIYDIGQNDTIITFSQAWDNHCLERSGIFPFSALFSVLPLLIFFIQWIVSFVQFSQLTKGNHNSTMKNLLQSLYSLLYPPVVVDWDSIYRANNEEMSILDCWKKSKKFLFIQIFINFLQHLVLCIPLIVLRLEIDQRNADLVNDFSLLNDELHSTHTANVLLSVGLSVSLALPFLQCGLLYLYFTMGHPWSCILKAQ